MGLHVFVEPGEQADAVRAYAEGLGLRVEYSLYRRARVPSGQVWEGVIHLGPQLPASDLDDWLSLPSAEKQLTSGNIQSGVNPASGHGEKDKKASVTLP